MEVLSHVFNAIFICCVMVCPIEPSGMLNGVYWGITADVIRQLQQIPYGCDVGAVSWSSRKQHFVTLSTTEAEFVAGNSCTCQAIRLTKFLKSCSSKKELLQFIATTQPLNFQKIMFYMEQAST